MSLQDALNVRFDSDAGDNITVRDYLHNLLVTLWREGECFDSKRPFGNSDWEMDLYEPLVKAGYIHGQFDEDGYLYDISYNDASTYIESLIHAAFYGTDEA